MCQSGKLQVHHYLIKPFREEKEMCSKQPFVFGICFLFSSPCLVSYQNWINWNCSTWKPSASKFVVFLNHIWHSRNPFPEKQSTLQDQDPAASKDDKMLFFEKKTTLVILLHDARHHETRSISAPWTHKSPPPTHAHKRFKQLHSQCISPISFWIPLWCETFLMIWDFFDETENFNLKLKFQTERRMCNKTCTNRVRVCNEIVQVLRNFAVAQRFICVRTSHQQPHWFDGIWPWVEWSNWTLISKYGAIVSKCCKWLSIMHEGYFTEGTWETNSLWSVS